MDNNWGNCMEMIIDDQYRWITTNSVPDYYFNPYCPIGRGYGYCVEQEVGKFNKKKMCLRDHPFKTSTFFRGRGLKFVKSADG